MPKTVKNLFLSKLETAEARWQDCMAAGDFVDMYGRPAIIKREDLALYVANTKRNIQATADAAGNVVGLPIDTLNHDHGAAAGWMIDVRLADGRDVVEYMPRWNEMGQGMIDGDTMRFFSPEFDPRAKAIIGGSLTNWPATRTREQTLLLRPIALSSQLSYYDESGYSKADECAYLCRECIRACAACIRQCQDDPNGGDPEHEACIKACQDCIVACEMFITAWETGTDAERVAACQICADCCQVCIDACAACAAVCSICAAACNRCAECCVACKTGCLENAGGGEEAPSAMQRAKAFIKRVFSGRQSASVPGSLSEPTEESMPVDVSKLTADERKRVLAQLTSGGDLPTELATLIDQKATERMSALLAVEQRKRDTAALAARLVGGTPEHPRGLPVDKAELADTLLSLSPEQAEKVSAILSKIQEKGAVEFSELGHGRELTGVQELPAEIAAKLDSQELSLADLASPILALGDLAQYNLSKWQKEK